MSVWVTNEEGQNEYADTGEISDGYHTFNELYEFRKLYNAAFFNELSANEGYHVHKSWKHSDGEDCFGGGWFIVTGYLSYDKTNQVSNHYEAEDWNLFKVEQRELADEWDGHTSGDVVKRLTNFIKEQQ